MSENQIFVPLISWLVGGSKIGGSYNIYCGSVGTDPLMGCMQQKITNYRIWIENLGETEILKACVYYGVISYDSINPEDVQTEIFELSEESREKIREWIESKIEK